MKPVEMISRDQLQHEQLIALNRLLSEVVRSNSFYQHKLQGVTLPLTSLDQLDAIPLTTKAELVAAGQHDPPTNLTYPLSAYSRAHQTSGTQGEPLRVFDTADDWRWWIDTWQFVLDAAKVEAADRALMAFSFGPFIGFWSAYDALVQRGCLVIPTGGSTTAQRLRMLLAYGATVVCCTPTYALRMAEVADTIGLDLATCGVKSLIVAGEPGGSVPAIRSRVEAAWGARLVDHAGSTEVGPWGFADAQRVGLQVAESQFIAEFLPVEQTPLKELVLTALGRRGWPVIRYRTGDLVKPRWDEGRFVLLEGGVQGRVDDMRIVRGVNVYPTAIDAMVSSVDGIIEYRTTLYRDGELDEIRVEIELHPDASDGTPAQLAAVFAASLGLRVNIETVPRESLPRFEAKSRRFFDQRQPE